MNRPKAFVFLISLFLFSSCGTTKIVSEAPEKEAYINTFQKKASVINIPISFDVKELENKVNQQFTGVIYKDNNINDDNYMVTVTKTGKISVFAENNKLYFNVPLHIWARGRWEWTACDFCPTLSKEGETNFDIIVKSKTAITITPDWKIKTVTEGDFDFGDVKPSISIGPLSINIRPIVESPLRSQFKSLTAWLDKEVQNKAQIKDLVKTAWTSLQDPILLNKDYDMWLKITPMELHATQLQASKGKLNIKIGVKSYIETYAGKQATDVNYILPNLIIDNDLNDEFLIGLKGEVTYETATQLLKNSLVGKPFDFEEGKYHILVNDLSISGTGSQMMVKMTIDASAKKGILRKKFAGDIYLKGTPYFDKTTASLKVKDFDFDIKSKDALVNTAAWMAKVGFEKKIESLLQFPLKDRLDQTKKMIQDGLDKNAKVNSFVTLKGTINDIMPDAIYLTDKSIIAIVDAKGKINVVVEKLY